MKKLFFLFLIIQAFNVFAADLKGLKSIFTSNFDNFYYASKCGMNIGRLLNEAKKRNIDLSNSYVLKIEGAGFLETSGFYTRGAINQRAMLGYFHFIFIADGYVFDFDLDEPLILKMEDYVRLQFTPPYLPFSVFGINFDPLKQLPYWTLHRFETNSYLDRPAITWTKKMGDVVDLKSVMNKERVR